jgi:hypothetical protein
MSGKDAGTKLKVRLTTEIQTSNEQWKIFPIYWLVFLDVKNYH